MVKYKYALSLVLKYVDELKDATKFVKHMRHNMII